MESISIMMSIPVFNNFLTEKGNQFLAEIPEKALQMGIRVLLALVLFIIGAWLIKIIRKIINKSMKKAHAETGVMQFVDSFLKAALYFVLVFLIASFMGVNAASIVALLGSAGVAIGLAVQGSLSNLAGGVLILLLKPFKVGDYIIENAGKQEGTVTEIQIFYTKLITPDQHVIVLPNGSLANNSIVNVTATKTRRLDIQIGISYDADIKKAKDVLNKVLQEDKDVLKDQDALVYVNELADSCVLLGVRCYVNTEDYWSGKWRITEQCKYALDEANISIPYPQIDVHFKDKDLQEN